jgi:predicted nucleic acid-binding Zn ribbon protein
MGERPVRTGRRRGPRPLSAAISTVRAGLAPRTLLAGVQERWAEAVGLEVARQAHPVAERAGVVTVSCASATWTSELSLLAPQLLERLNGGLSNGPRVRAFRFVTGPLDR